MRVKVYRLLKKNILGYREVLVNSVNEDECIGLLMFFKGKLENKELSLDYVYDEVIIEKYNEAGFARKIYRIRVPNVVFTKQGVITELVMESVVKGNKSTLNLYSYMLTGMKSVWKDISRIIVYDFKKFVNSWNKLSEEEKKKYYEIGLSLLTK